MTSTEPTPPALHVPGTAREQLLSLAATSQRSLTEVERHLTPRRTYAERLEHQLAQWHQQLDETRLQAALAEMELRDVREAVIVTLEDHAR